MRKKRRTQNKLVIKKCNLNKLKISHQRNLRWPKQKIKQKVRKTVGERILHKVKHKRKRK